MSATSAVYGSNPRYRICCTNNLWRVEWDTGLRSTREANGWVAWRPLVERTLAEEQLAVKSAQGATLLPRSGSEI